ncbi:hypothetical protein EV122DRAFT_256148 [Schizophyllum commune]
MTNTEGTSNAGYQAEAVENPRKRKWTTQMMKTWVATDPTRTAPVIQHRDPKAAARAEKKKKRKIEKEFAAKTSDGCRAIQHSPANLESNYSDLTYDPERYFSNPYLFAYGSTQDRRAMLPPPEAYGAVDYPASSWTAGANGHMFDTLIPFEKEKRTLWDWNTAKIAKDHELESARWSSPDGSVMEQPEPSTPEADVAELARVERAGSSDTNERNAGLYEETPIQERIVQEAENNDEIDADQPRQRIRASTNGEVGVAAEFATTRMDVDEGSAQALTDEDGCTQVSDALRLDERLSHSTCQEARVEEQEMKLTKESKKAGKGRLQRKPTSWAAANQTKDKGPVQSSAMALPLVLNKNLEMRNPKSIAQPVKEGGTKRRHVRRRQANWKAADRTRGRLEEQKEELRTRRGTTLARKACDYIGNI